MKTIEQIMNYEPQIAKLEHGTEPSLAHILETYYLEHYAEPDTAKAFVTLYAEALKEFSK